MKNIRICGLNEVKNNPVIKYVDDIRDEIIVFYIDNQLTIRSSICPHFGGELYLDKKQLKLRCKWHAWEYDPVSGRCLTYKLKTKIREYSIKPFPGDLNKYDFFIKNMELFLRL